jgi:RNA polymerase sigma-70 factor, ECF subfamily
MVAMMDEATLIELSRRNIGRHRMPESVSSGGESNVDRPAPAGAGQAAAPVDDPHLAGMLAGDVGAMAEYFALVRPRLERIVRFRLDARLQGRVDPEDILQEAYVDAAARLAAFGEVRPMSALVWLRLIVGQTLIDVHRRHLGAQMRDAHRERSIQDRLADGTSMTMSFQLLGAGTSPSRAAVRAELSELVSQALEEMNPIDREVLALRHFEELTNKETAEVLGIEVKAASIRYVRALERLKGVLKDVPGFFD